MAILRNRSASFCRAPQALERLGAVAGQGRLPRLPVIVIGADIVRSEPAISGMRPGAETEITREAILARLRRRRQRTALAQEQPPRRLDRRPAGRFPPRFGVHA